MGCCNEPVTTLTSLPADSSLHVNYERGMVLGVDDFRQEFAYHSGRDQWLARDAIGYGTLVGLKVGAEDAGADGPRLRVTAGSALAVSGQLICVGADQCCVLNQWLAKAENAALVNRLLTDASTLSPPLSPPAAGAGMLALYLTLCYTDCRTAPVPIPGEPCRSEDELMAPSRIADDYCLELRADPPQQVEEEALRDFVQWLKDNVQVVESASPPGDDAGWLASLRGAAQAWADAMSASPPLAPPPSAATLGDYLFNLASPLEIGLDQLRPFLRVAFRFWVTELRPLWMARSCRQPPAEEQDCTLLARIEFPVIWIGGSPSGVWQVDGDRHVVLIDETERPFLLHTRLLQEWMLFGGGGVGSVSSLPQALSVTATPTFSGLTITGALTCAFTETTGDITLNETHHVVVCLGSCDVNLPKCGPGNKGRLYSVRSVTTASNFQHAAGDKIVGGNSIPVSNPKMVVSNGIDTWYVL